MTSRSTWKAHERKAARMFGTERNPLSGICGKHTGSDSLHPKLYIESKYRRRNSSIQLFKATAEKAKIENKIPVLALKEKGTHGTYYVIKYENLKEVLECLTNKQE
jgi:hypothetical protein